VPVTAFRLFLHVLSASVWVGGQIVLAGLLPTVRTLGDDAPRRVARAFNRLAWPAFVVAVVTGLWNVVAIPLNDLQHPWIELKVLFVLLTGVGAAVHQVAKGNRAMLAVGGAMSSIFAVAAMYTGFLVTPVP
jgi:succinate-acetate transporter protein